MCISSITREVDVVKFIHTADWQLGMTRHFLEGEAQARYTQARYDAVRKIGELADTESCDFVIVSGDVFESNLLDRQVIARSLDALRSFTVPVFLLPGNHDPLNAASVYQSSEFTSNCPKGVTVLEHSSPINIDGIGVEIIGAPWDSKEPLEDLVSQACSNLAAPNGVFRVVVGHGVVDTVLPGFGKPSVIHGEDVERYIDIGTVHYVGLGDRHSLTEVGNSRRFWYSGTPLVTDYDETLPNQVLLVALGDGSIDVQARQIGDWHFYRELFDVNNDDDVNAVNDWFEQLENKQYAVVKLDFVGTLSVASNARLEQVILNNRDLFAAIELGERASDLHVIPDSTDVDSIDVSGFAKATLQELLDDAAGDDEDALEVRDALGILFRLAGGVR